MEPRNWILKFRLIIVNFDSKRGAKAVFMIDTRIELRRVFQELEFASSPLLSQMTHALALA
jgi:hypothetical protein|tara:strand:- start:457 stop:639 length:183 start_codon:yes stop_codon:yes gene_type:complete